MGNNVSSRLVPAISEAEQRVREDLAAAYRLVALYGMDDSIYTHISARVPGTEDRFLINPFGMLFRDITASSLVCIDLDGNIISGPPGFNEHCEALVRRVVRAGDHAVEVLDA